MANIANVTTTTTTQKQHTVIVYNWDGGVLQFEERVVNTLAEALDIIGNITSFTSKIYNLDGVLVEVVNAEVPVETYVY